MWDIAIPPNSTGTIELPCSDASKAKLDGKPVDSLVIKNVASGSHRVEIAK